MPISRRNFLEFASAFSVAASYPAAVRAVSDHRTIKALAFDAFPIFDPRKISHVGFEIYGDQGRNLVSLWFPKIFNYMFFLTAAKKYAEFGVIAQHSLRYASRSMNIMLSHPDEDKLIGAFYELSVWPDVMPALQSLQKSDTKKMFLSNMPSDMLRRNIDRNGLNAYFDSVVGSDTMECYKPSPDAYRRALEVFGLPHDEIGFVAFGHWDAVGATWFGYQTAWINRTNSLPDELETQPKFMTSGIDGALLLVK